MSSTDVELAINRINARIDALAEVYLFELKCAVIAAGSRINRSVGQHIRRQRSGYCKGAGFYASIGP